MKTLIVAATIVALAGCASSPPTVTHASSAAYEPLGCPALAVEVNRIDRKRETLDAAISNRTTQNMIVGSVGLLLFWPALFLYDPGTVDAQEVVKLRAEREAITDTMARKGCGAAS